jgi:competence protein ComEA
LRCYLKKRSTAYFKSFYFFQSHQEFIMLIKQIFAVLLSVCASMAFAATDVNKATQAELEAVKGIGPAMATRIMEQRQKTAFADWGDLRTRVKGVGVKKAAKFSGEGVTVNGAAYVASAEPLKASAKASTKAVKLAAPL